MCSVRSPGEAQANLLRVLHPGLVPHSGMVFTDTDVYKALEAAGLGAAGPDSLGCPRCRRSSTCLRAAHGARRLPQLLGAGRRPTSPAGQIRSGVTSFTPRPPPPGRGRRHAHWRAARSGRASGMRFADLLVTTFGAGHRGRTSRVTRSSRWPWSSSTGRPGRRIPRPCGPSARRPRARTGWVRAGSAPPTSRTREPLREATVATGHAVRQLYLMAGAVDIAVETGDGELLAAVERLWDDLYTTKTYLTGVHGSRHRDEAIGDRYELPPDRAYAETCAAIAAFQLNWRLLLATGQGAVTPRRWRSRSTTRSRPRPLRTGTRSSTSTLCSCGPTTTASGDTSPAGSPGSTAPAARRTWPGCSPACHDYLVTTSDRGIQLHHITAGARRRPAWAAIAGAHRRDDGLPARRGRLLSPST